MVREARGFTLIEILIVVIILGILAMIVIPQFTNASNDARTTSIKSQLQTMRSQIALFKAQHNDVPPQATAITGWQLMLTRSDTTETNLTNPVGTKFGPYMQSAPTNPFNGKTGVSTAASDTNAGWYYTVSGSMYTLQARNLTGAAMTSY